MLMCLTDVMRNRIDRSCQMKRKITGMLALAMALAFCTMPAHAADAKKSYKLAVSIYTGWMPWYYANETGIVKKWADKYGIKIDVKYMDYVPSIEAYVAGQADALVATNMETLDMPAAAGVDSSVVVMGDYSNGNDALLVRDKLTMNKLKGQTVYLVEKTVSQYLLSRALETVKMHEKDVKVMNVSDSDIAPSFLANSNTSFINRVNSVVDLCTSLLLCCVLICIRDSVVLNDVLKDTITCLRKPMFIMQTKAI